MRLTHILIFLAMASSANAGFGSILRPIFERSPEPDIIDIAIQRVRKSVQGIAQQALEALGLSYAKQEVRTLQIDDDPALSKYNRETAQKKWEELDKRLEEGAFLSAKEYALYERLARFFEQNAVLSKIESTDAQSAVGVWRAPPASPEAVCERMKIVVEGVLADGAVTPAELESWVNATHIQTQNETTRLKMLENMSSIASRIYGNNETEQREAQISLQGYAASPLIMLAALVSAPQSCAELRGFIATARHIFQENPLNYDELTPRFKMTNPYQLMAYWILLIKKQTVSEDSFPSVIELKFSSRGPMEGALLGKGASSRVYAIGTREAYKCFKIVDEIVEPSWCIEAFNLALVNRAECAGFVAIDSCQFVRSERGVLTEFGIISERMVGTLPECIRPGILEIQEIKSVIRFLLTTTCSLHQLGISHNDIKPSNILVSKDYEVKINDFGLSSWFGLPVQERARELVTLWYRAPEALSTGRTYGSPALDIWSIGCILGELSLRAPLFRGKNAEETLIFQMRLLLPEHAEGFRSLCGDKFVDKISSTLQKSPCIRRQDLDTYLGPLGTKFLFCLLNPNPQERITAETALKHPWFTEQAGVSAAACSQQH